MARVLLMAAVSIVTPAAGGGADPEGQGALTVTRGKAELRTPHFVFRLGTSDGLRAESWENRLTGTKVSLGNGPELGLDIGPGEKSATPLKLRLIGLPKAVEGEAGKGVFELQAESDKISARVTYHWDVAQPVLRKTVEVRNNAQQPLDRLLNVRLGTYSTDANHVSARGPGFPLYVNGEFFVGLAHPSGWAVNHGKEVSLRHHPGARVAPGQSVTCMEAVYGVAEAGGAREAFLAHLASRMRRVARHHDRPFAIFDALGGQPGNDSWWEPEGYLLDNIRKVAQGQKESGCGFDYYCLCFWHDVRGDGVRFDPGRFPRGFGPIKAELAKLGALPGMWIDSGGNPGWSIGGNPAIRPAMTDPSGRGAICRAAEPAKSLYTKAFLHHIKENGVRLLKFDHNGNKGMRCDNPHHEHLPGIYSTEANHNAIIEFLRTLDRACPDVFLMLYWGYDSPWWLLHADTIFDCGLGIEARDPASQPTPYPRDSVIQRMDQGVRNAASRLSIPLLGKDSLGVWLSHWRWNSSIEKERWQESLVMDICRGSMLVQVWTDTDWLSPAERAQLAEFIALVKARPECFRNSRWIVGDPWKNEPYGYCCTDGRRAFLAINNACWKDSSVALKLNSEWDLPDRGSWDIYRWYPAPARLVGGKASFEDSASITMRPFEVVLLEVVPSGQAASLERRLGSSPIPAGFAEPTKAVDFAPVAEDPVETKPAEKSIWTPLEVTSTASSAGTTLTVQKDGSVLAGGKNPPQEVYTVAATTGLTGITAVQLEVLCDSSLPSGGPGRAVNGNFALTGLRVTAAPADRKADAVAVSLRGAQADFSQTSYGGWPVTAALDGKPATGWSIDPGEGDPHVAVFETAKPVGFDGGTVLTFTLEQGFRQHGIGRFRLSATTTKPPVPAPAECRGGRAGVGRRMRGQIPPASKGGTLVVIDSGGFVEARLEGRPAACTQVWKPSHSRAPWQAWRIPVDPSDKRRAIEILVSGRAAQESAWKGFFVPLDR